MHARLPASAARRGDRTRGLRGGRRPLQLLPAPKFAPERLIDDAIRAAWEKEGVHPAPTVDDARFLRRVYLDLTGVIPPPEAVLAFLADASLDKRRAAL